MVFQRSILNSLILENVEIKNKRLKNIKLNIKTFNNKSYLFKNMSKAVKQIKSDVLNSCSSLFVLNTSPPQPVELIKCHYIMKYFP